jgi:FixJ family two-component response regulator
MIPFGSDRAHRQEISRMPGFHMRAACILKATRMSNNPVIVIIDDDEAVRIATSCLLRSYGYDTRVFASAEDFLNSGMDAEASCLITDVQMPGLGGMELQQILIARKCPIPIVFITAFGNEAVRNSALAAGAFCFLEKPFDGDAMVRCLQDALESGKRPV